MSISLDPYVTTNSENSFLLQSDGFVVGTLYGKFPDRYTLEGGTVGSGQTTPIYGGLPLALTVQTPGSGGSSSGTGQTAVLAATSGANIEAWCLFDQASAGVITPSSNVPLYSAGNSINFVRVGSGAMIVLPVKAADVDTIAGGLATQTLYWDFTNNYVTVSAGTGALGYQIIALNTNSKTVTYASGPPITANWNDAGSAIVVRI